MPLALKVDKNIGIHPWNKTVWEELIAEPESGRKPHAFLFCGSYGLGKRALAEAYARHVLLSDMQPDSTAKTLFDAGTHPDMHVLMSEAAVDKQPNQTFSRFALRYIEEHDRKPKQVISVAQVRALGHSIVSTTANKGSRVIVLPDASAMNVNAANSLLKNLEEPPGNTLFILVSDRPDSLPATIRSRCTPIYFRIPEIHIARSWLEQLARQGASEGEALGDIENIDDLLAFAGGAPLAAVALHQTGEREQHSRVLRQLCDVLSGKTEPLGAAKQWHDESPELIVRLVQRLFSDIVRCRSNEAIEPAFYTAQKQWLHQQGKRLNLHKLFLLWQQILKTAHLMSGTSDKLLILESLAIDLAKAGKEN
jgi:DNA polymerase III subunit delta'